MWLGNSVSSARGWGAHTPVCPPEVEGAENKVDMGVPWGKPGLKCFAYQI